MTVGTPVLSHLLAPRSVALIGVGEDAGTFSGAPLANLIRHGWQGKIFPVNPRRDLVRGLRCYPSLDDLPEVPESAVITIAAQHAVSAVAACAIAGVRAVTLVSSGFGEGAAGEEGLSRQRELASAIAGTGMQLLGPNTTGVINLWDSYVPRAAFNHLAPELLHAGPVALVTQSGACSNVVFNRAQSAGVAVGCVVATGGQADLTVWQVAEALLDDPRTSVVMAVVEDLGNAVAVESASIKASELGKSIVLLKLGQSDAGKAAVLAHSASLAGDAKVQRAACRSLGIHWVDDFDALWEVATLLQRWGRPASGRRRLGVVAFSGGEGALIADAATKAGFELPEPGPALAKVVARDFAYATAANPFDPSGEVIGDPDKLTEALATFCEGDAFTDVLLASPIFGEELAAKLYPPVERALKAGHPRVLLSSWRVDGLTALQDTSLRALELPLIDNSVRAVQALGAYYDVGAAPIFVAAPARPGNAVAVSADASYWNVREALGGAGLRFGRARRVTTTTEVQAASDDLGFPLVAKADVPSSTHKSALGLVMTGLRSAEAVHEAVEHLHRESGLAVVLERQGSGELQLLLGVHRDPHFGPVLVVGSGGVSVEAVDDTAVLVLRYARPAHVTSCLAATAAGRFLQNRSADAFADALRQAATLARWFDSQKHLNSVEVNPAFADLRRGLVTCVDARVQ